MATILNIPAILSDHYRFAPIGQDKDTLERFLSELPKADIYSGLIAEFCSEAGDTLSDTRPAMGRNDIAEQLRQLFGAMVKELTPLGVITKYKNVNFADYMNRNSYSSNFDFLGDKIITEEIKLNRFLKRFTILHDFEIDKIGTAFIQSRNPELFLESMNYTIATTRKAMRAIYGAAIPDSYKSRGNYKCIIGSCMQGLPENLPDAFYGYSSRTLESWQEIHPCEAYASGDFALHALTYKDSGLPAARVLVAANGSTGPIYADSKLAGDALAIAALAQGLTLPARGKGEFAGLSLLYLTSSRGLVATPYLDTCEGYARDGDLFRLGRGSDIGNTSGFTDQGGIDGCDESIYCDQCSDWFDESDMNRTANGDMVCDSCRHHYYFTSDESGELYHDSESCSVYSEHGRWITISESERDNGDYHYCDYRAEYIHSDYMVMTECGISIFEESADCIELNGLYYIRDSEEHIAAIRITELDEEDRIEAERIAQLPYCQQPVTRDPDTMDLFYSVGIAA